MVDPTHRNRRTALIVLAGVLVVLLAAIVVGTALR